MTIQVHLGEDRLARRLLIVILNQDPDGSGSELILSHVAGTHRWIPLPTDEEPRPTIELSHDVARALLDALTRHFHGAEDTRALRRDYDAERRRVDEQAGVLADVLRTLAAASRTVQG